MSELIVALDAASRQKALALAASLRPLVKWFKVGLELFISTGPEIIAQLANLDCKVFLDLKIYDIPNTAAGAAAAAIRPGIGLFTIHLQGGERMCRAVSNAFAGSGIICAGVTALTSFKPGEMPGIDDSPQDYAFDLAMAAPGWGLGAIVCAASEAARIRASAPELLLICPGIRPAGDAANDQGRIATPGAAIKAGADFLVVGRPITQAKHPLMAAKAILAEMEKAN